MKLFISIVVISIAASSTAEQRSQQQQIEETLRALPEALRDGAAVIGYNSNGELCGFARRDQRNDLLGG